MIVLLTCTGLVGACGISVLCSLLRVHLFLEERWEKPLFIFIDSLSVGILSCFHSSFEVFDDDILSFGSGLLWFFLMHLISWTFFSCFLQLKWKKWDSMSEDNQSKMDQTWTDWDAPLSHCYWDTIHSGLPCGCTGGTGVLSSSCVWMGYSWTCKYPIMW